jgi:arylsulfatase A-like enzyme
MLLGRHAATAQAATKAGEPAAARAGRPNIVYILADDMGYGDLRCLNKDGKIATPNMDRLASGGMVFTDAHSGSSVCTPTRYGILTGRYSWRTRLASGVLMGYSKPLIDPGRMTVASLLKSRGYHTAGLGKWHLGLGLPTTDGKEPAGNGANVDFAAAIANGLPAVGFDYYYGISASLDMPPYVYVHNDRFVAVPTTTRTYIRKGLATEDFQAVEVLPTLTAKAVQYIDERAKAAAGGDDKPFFLYMPLSAPHTPIAPTKDFQGKSGLNDYGDFVMQVDHTIGQVMDALGRNGLADNTLVILTSDNGCSPAANFPQLLAKGHNPSYVFRGHKADIFEGGHRIPFIARWPGRVKPGSACGQTICLTDLLATCAAIVGAKLPDNAGEDSVNILPALTGAPAGPLREAVVHHSIAGSFSIRQGKWKLELCPGSGGWSDPKPGSKEERGLPDVQLYDLAADISERRNLQAEQPDVTARLTALLQSYVDNGRSTPGAPQKNDRNVTIAPPKPKAPASQEGREVTFSCSLPGNAALASEDKNTKTRTCCCIPAVAG